jgi:drug/metabolite transporter (DMT)-like permease
MNESARGHLAMLWFSALVAGSFSLGTLVANDIAPMALSAARFLIAATLLSVLVVIGPGFKRAHFQASWRYFVLGACFAIYFVLMFEGLKTAPPVSAGAVFTLIPLLTAGFAYVILHQVVTARIALALCVGASGAVWVIFRADIGALMAFEVGQGEIIYFFGCIAHAVFVPLLRVLGRGEPALVATSLVMAAGCCTLTFFGWSDLQATDWAQLSSLVWITLAYVSIFATAATVMLLQYATKRLPSSKVMAYTYLTPSWIILWEVAKGNGVPPALVLPGVALSVIAVLLLLKNEQATQA